MELMSVNGVRLEVQRIAAAPLNYMNHANHINPGQPDLAPLVFLHEGLGSVAMWRDWPARLCTATGRAGWVYSRRGYGQSDPVTDVRGSGRLSADYLHREAWDVLPALLAALNVTMPVLIGHSDGASIALLHASRFDVAACVVMAPHIMVEDISVQSIAQARDAYDSADLRTRLSRYHADVDGAFWQWNDVWLSRDFRSFDIRPHCQRIKSPVLAIQGLDDVYGSMRQIDEISPSGPITRHKLAQCGHSAQRDQADLTLQLICEFLETAD
jgi:pimeloyl-ACP methyl ester carboxylesterase